MNHIGMRPPSGVNESCIEFTAPQEVVVVTAANNAELTTPKRVSLPSMLPPDCVADAVWSTPSLASAGLPAVSDHTATDIKVTNTTAIAAKIAQPWRLSPTILPNEIGRAH